MFSMGHENSVRTGIDACGASAQGCPSSLSHGPSRSSLECGTVNRSYYFANEEKDMTAVMGMNLSNTFQSNPIPLRNGADQIANLPVSLVKLFSLETDPNFWASVSQHGLKVALGISN